MTQKIEFPFSYLIAGYVTQFNPEDNFFLIKTQDTEYRVFLKSNTYAYLLRNLGYPYYDCTAQIHHFLKEGSFLYAFCIFYPETEEYILEVQYLIFTELKQGEFIFSKNDWWIKQLKELSEFYLKSQFGNGPIDYSHYRTFLTLDGGKTSNNYRQDTNTISRMVGGFACAYMLTGEDRFLEVSEKGCEYLRNHMRFLDTDKNIIVWYYGIDVQNGHEQKIIACESGDDFNTIPAYEQIYALAGHSMTYRLNMDPNLLNDIDLTINLFESFFFDKQYGGYFSHLNPITLDPKSDVLGHNQAKKNWNSIGDHIPVYLIHILLATGNPKYAQMLEYVCDLIVKHFPDHDNSPLVLERFMEDWTPDLTYSWQQNRGIIGHNLKITWNLMRMYNYKQKPEYLELAKKIADIMPDVGLDKTCGGWFDALERNCKKGQKYHRFSFHDRKAWWQQEQAILAYMILHGTINNDKYHSLAMESSAFYNAFFLDHEDSGIYFNLLASGTPYLLGTERLKGSHSMSSCHSFELAFLAQTYNNLLIMKKPLDLYFSPLPNQIEERTLRVSPDILPKGRIRISHVWINDKPYSNFDSLDLTVIVPKLEERVKIRVRLEPV
jgi:mannose/cellobiose epimerase-like protein (N-acyl-D-glucosamine 2-epimerase family)